MATAARCRAFARSASMIITDLSELSLSELTAIADEFADDCRLAAARGDDSEEWARLEPILLELASR